MGARMQTRPIVPADRARWFAMRNALWPGKPEEHAAAIDAFFEGRAAFLDAAFLCEADAVPVGFVELRIRGYAEDSDSARVPYVEGWYVDPAYRRRNVGALLMARAEQWAQELGYHELGSDCEIDNATSIAAHNALGFEETARLVCFLKRIDPRGA
jgi:aminoglycoside 6'-N-acetyltransferase I